MNPYKSFSLYVRRKNKEQITQFGGFSKSHPFSVPISWHIFLLAVSSGFPGLFVPKAVSPVLSALLCHLWNPSLSSSLILRRGDFRNQSIRDGRYRECSWLWRSVIVFGAGKMLSFWVLAAC